MRKICRTVLLCSAAVASFGLLMQAQEAQNAPSLGDAARQARQQKQSKEARNKTTPATKKANVITDDNIVRSQPDSTPAAAAGGDDPAAAEPATAPAGKLSADEWRSRIQAQHETVTNLQHNIDELNQSIQFAPGNCVAGCVEWNKHQKEKQQEVERMQEELKAQQQKLEDIQEAARQQGYGSSITDP